MTVFHTETHLTQDPIYNYTDHSAIFMVALSNFNIPCHIHRQDNVNYLQSNDVRSGDLVYLHGIFVTENGGTGATYIKVQSIRLKTEPDFSKKRKLQEATEYVALGGSLTGSSSMSLAPSPTRLTSLLQSRYMSVDLTFSNYYFLVAGQAYSLLDSCNSYIQIHGLPPSVIQEKGQFLNGALKQLHVIYGELHVNGLNRLQVENFVNTATMFVDILNEIHEDFPVDLLPPRITLSSKVPLPTPIYNAFISEQ